jgi:hypothetical protein
VASIRWERDLRPAAWLATRVHRSQRLQFAQSPNVGERALAIDGYEDQARLPHPWGRHRAMGGGLTVEQRRALVEILRGETGTPERCWFCVPDGRRELDDQGISERVVLAGNGPRYLLHGGPVEQALVPPPQKPLPVVIEDDARLEDLARELSVKLAGYSDLMMGFGMDSTPAELREALGSLLQEVAPNLWWPEDRAWFVAVVSDETRVAGSRRLTARLRAEVGAV